MEVGGKGKGEECGHQRLGKGEEYGCESAVKRREDGHEA